MNHFQERLECEENASKLLKLFDSEIIDNDGNRIIKKSNRYQLITLLILFILIFYLLF